MSTEKENLLKFLDSAWIKKLSFAHNYSRNALARDMGVSSPYISNIFSGKKLLPESKVDLFSRCLELDIQEKDKLRQLIFLVKNPSAKQFEKSQNQKSENLSERSYLSGEQTTKLIDEWFYIPLLEFFNFPHSLDHTDRLAKSLGIEKFQVENAYSLFIELGLLEKDEDGLWFRKNKHQYLPIGKTRNFVRDFHTNMMSLAQGEIKKIGPDSYQQRLMTSYTFSLAPERLEELKQVIHNFLDKSTQDFEATNKNSHVYQFNVQLFPLIKN